MFATDPSASFNLKLLSINSKPFLSWKEHIQVLSSSNSEGVDTWLDKSKTCSDVLYQENLNWLYSSLGTINGLKAKIWIPETLEQYWLENGHGHPSLHFLLQGHRSEQCENSRLQLEVQKESPSHWIVQSVNKLVQSDVQRSFSVMLVHDLSVEMSPNANNGWILISSLCGIMTMLMMTSWISITEHNSEFT